MIGGVTVTDVVGAVGIAGVTVFICGMLLMCCC